MINSIYTIPIHEVFEPQCGCPVCRVRSMLEERCLTYIMGAAMMEPSIRIETNQYGFCSDHLKMMLGKQNKLSLALMLETHLNELEAKHVVNQTKSKKGLSSPAHTCFVCMEVQSAMDKILDNTLTLYSNDTDFGTLFCKQEFFCFPHYNLLCVKATSRLPKKNYLQFMDDITNITRTYLTALKQDVHDFALMSDYRNSKMQPTEKVLSSLERAIPFLTTRK